MRNLVFGVLVLSAAGVPAAQAQDMTALLQANACSACHQAEARMVGPSWKEVADRYRDGSKTAAQLSESIKNGGSGTWGAVPMPPQAQLNDADRLSIAEWILTSH